MPEPSPSRDLRELYARAQAAWQLAAAGQLDGAAGLGFALWPTVEMEEASASRVEANDRRPGGRWPPEPSPPTR